MRRWCIELRHRMKWHAPMQGATVSPLAAAGSRRRGGGECGDGAEGQRMIRATVKHVIQTYDSHRSPWTSVPLGGHSPCLRAAARLKRRGPPLPAPCTALGSPPAPSAAAASPGTRPPPARGEKSRAGHAQFRPNFRRHALKTRREHKLAIDGHGGEVPLPASRARRRQTTAAACPASRSGPST